jgi:hypothetical protein
VSTTATPAPRQLRPSPPRPRTPIPSPPHKRKTWLWVAAGASFLLLLAPVALFAGAGNPPGCDTAATGGPGGINDTGGTAAGGHFAAPLQLQQGQWYRVGATEYGPPGTGDYGSDPDPGQSDLATHPDSYAELSTLDTNPANISPTISRSPTPTRSGTSHTGPTSASLVPAAGSWS